MVALPGIAILSKIYESSSSLVYRGISVPDDRAIVIKMLKQNYPSPQELTRYRQEYKITRSLKEEGVSTLPALKRRGFFLRRDSNEFTL